MNPGQQPALGNPNPHGWQVELKPKAQIRKILPGWKGHVLKRCLKLRHCVLTNRSENIVKFLRTGANVDFQDESMNGQSLVHLAALLPLKSHSREPSVLEVLLDAGADANLKDRSGNTPMHLAALHSRPWAIKVLLAHHITPNAKNTMGLSPLHYAAEAGNIEGLRVLLKEGAINAESGEGKLPVHYAIEKQRKDVAMALFQEEIKEGTDHWVSFKRDLLVRYPNHSPLKAWLTEIDTKGAGASHPSSKQNNQKHASETGPIGAGPSTTPKEAKPSTSDQIKARLSHDIKLGHGTEADTTSKRTLVLARLPQGTFGIKIIGGIEDDLVPVITLIPGIQPKVVSGDLRDGDEVVSVNGTIVTEETHMGICQLFASSGQQVSLEVITPSVNRLNELLFDETVQDTIKTQIKNSVFNHKIPLTTRLPRNGEEHGREFYFVSHDMFETLLKDEMFVEWGATGQHKFGTLKHTITSGSEFCQQLQLAVVTLRRCKDRTFGFTLTGGLETDEFPTFHRKGNLDVVSTSVRDGVKDGDLILAINGVNVAGETEGYYEEIMGLTANEVELLVIKKQAGEPFKLSKLITMATNDARLSAIQQNVAKAVYDATVPYTTRMPRDGEVDGVDYHFITLEEFKVAIKRGEFIEWGERGGVFYGTKKAIEKAPRTKNTSETKSEGKEPESKKPAFKHTIDDEGPDQDGRKYSCPAPSVPPSLPVPTGPPRGSEDLSEHTLTNMKKPNENIYAAQASKLQMADTRSTASLLTTTSLSTATPTNDAPPPPPPRHFGITDEVQRNNPFELFHSNLYAHTAPTCHGDTESQLMYLTNYLQTKFDFLSDKDEALLEDEFESMREVGANLSKNVAEANKARNRYVNILAYDHSRVVLKIEENDTECDYINANFIPGYTNAHQYIATQGPNPISFGTFWRMIWQQRVPVIVMVTNEHEGGKLKCDRYWPDIHDSIPKPSMIYDTILVTHRRTDHQAHFEIRTFSISRVGGSEERTVYQYVYTSWPDHGAPQSTTPILQFRKSIREHTAKESGPLVVHCSAGVGRSGTYIAVDSILESIEDIVLKKKGELSLKDCKTIVDVRQNVTRMREHRNLMVQTIAQYKFIYETVIDGIFDMMMGLDKESETSESAPTEDLHTDTTSEANIEELGEDEDGEEGGSQRKQSLEDCYIRRDQALFDALSELPDPDKQRDIEQDVQAYMAMRIMEGSVDGEEEDGSDSLGPSTSRLSQSFAGIKLNEEGYYNMEGETLIEYDEDEEEEEIRTQLPQRKLLDINLSSLEDGVSV